MRRALPVGPSPVALALAGLAAALGAQVGAERRASADPPSAIPGGVAPGVEQEPWYTRKADTRSGIVLGFVAGGGVAGSSGYPNSATKIGDPDYYSASGFMAGSSGAFLLMYALSDYLSFGVWAGSAKFQNKDWTSRGVGGGFRVEAFPFYAFVPKLKNLGVLGQFGIGNTVLDAKFKAGVSSDGTESYLGTGVFYEWSVAKFFGGHASLGPSLEYDAIVTEAIQRSALTLNLRAVFYGGP
jgi:hypothetical protein